MQKRIIGFQELPSLCFGQHIASDVKNVLIVYEIHQKIFSISFDNASNNKVPIYILKSTLNPILDHKLFHVRCACYIINLCYQMI